MAELTPYYQDELLTIYHGDCRDVIPQLPVRVHNVVTDPPYALTNRVRDVPYCDKCHRVYGGSDQIRVGEPCVRCGNPTIYRRTNVGAGFMGKDWDTGLVAFTPEVWSLLLSACLPGAHLLACGGTRTYHRLTCAIEDAGWQIRDCLMYIFGSGFPKGLDVSKAIDKEAGLEMEVVGVKWTRTQNEKYGNGKGTNTVSLETAPASAAAKHWDGYGSALKPAYEPIVLARAPLDGTIAANVQKHNTGALNIDGCRVQWQGPCDAAAAAAAIGFRTSQREGKINAKTYGMDNQEGIPEYNNQTSGRFPANIILDGSPEVEALFPETTSNNHVSRRKSDTKSSGKCMGNGWRDDTYRTGFSDSGSAARFFYTAKASSSERGAYNSHPTCKPLALMGYLIRLVSPPSGGIILDPFMGSGTTLIAAANEKQHAIGIEQDEHNCAIAVKRIRERIPELMAFAGT